MANSSRKAQMEFHDIPQNGNCFESFSLRWSHPQASAGNQWHCFGAAFQTLSAVTHCVAVALSPPRYLSFSELSHSSVRVSWEPASPAVKGHRVTYMSSRGSNTGEVSPQGLLEGELGGHTLPCSLWCVEGWLSLKWALLRDVLSPLQLSPCSSLPAHPSPLQVEVPGTAMSTVLRPLSSLTQYFISVRSMYDEGDSFPITGNVTTCK